MTHATRRQLLLASASLAALAAGADATVTMADRTFGTGTDTLVGQRPVIGYVLSLKGLMANVKIDGAKIGRLSL